MENKQILLVEDDQFLRTLYTDLLKTEHYLIETAVDGEQAFNKIKTGGWSLILLDIILPKIDGLTVVDKLKNENPDSLKQKIVFLTNLDQSDTINKIKLSGFPYLVKSDLNPEQFINQIKKFLG